MADAATAIERYRWFADNEAAGHSEIYREWAEGVIADPGMLARLVELPSAKRQPHLVFASARFCGAPLDGYDVAGPWMHEHWDAILEVVLERATQTNEAARCATILPVLAALDGPLALIEVGASAGLCLIPDRYGYRYEHGGTVTDIAGDPGAPVLPCRMSGAEPPARIPEIVWRAGIDLNPLDATDPDDTRWLGLLVWPEQEERRNRLRAALALVAADPVRIVRGDLVEALPALAAEAPPDATLVVMHTAVLNYLTADHRRAAIDVIRATGARWVSNEGIRVLDEVNARLPAGLGEPPRYVLALDEHPVALTGFHGGVYEALDAQPR